MSLPNGDERLELRDTKGNTLGFFLPEQVLQEQAAEREALCKQIADMQARLDALTREKEGLLKEVDNYSKILEVWEQDGIAPMTRKELEHAKKHGIPFETVIAEIEEMIQSRSSGA
jgi:cell division protein FtsB